MPRRGDAGATLIELMLVVAIVSILSFGAVLGMGGDSLREGAPLHEVRALALGFEQDIAKARAQSRIARQIGGLRPSGGAWVLGWLGAQGWRDRPPRGAGATAWQVEGRRLTGAGGPQDAPPILILPDGRITPFALRLSLPDGVMRCATDGWKAVTCDPV